MLLPVCMECAYGGMRDGQSHCGRESVYSYLTLCIQRVALEDYLRRHSVAESTGKAAGNQ